MHASIDSAFFIHDWSFDPGIVVPLALSGALYAIGTRKLALRSTNAFAAAIATRRKQQGFFIAGWLTLTLSLISPLHELSEQLFSAHMVQHELLMTVAAPLLVLSRPLVPMLWALPTKWRAAVQRTLHSTPLGTQRLSVAGTFLVRPAIAWLIFGVTVWVWHMPALFQQTLVREWVHALQHLSFLLASLIFWQAMLLHRPVARRGLAVLYLFTTAVHTSVLGALITFDDALWYPLYARRAAELGVSALSDQQSAGLIMWVPGSVPYLIAAITLLIIWLGRSSRDGWTVAERALIARSSRL